MNETIITLYINFTPVSRHPVQCTLHTNRKGKCLNPTYIG